MPFRSIGEPDHLDDQKARMSQDKLDGANFGGTLTKSALPIVILAVIFLAVNAPFGLNQRFPIASAILFVVGLLSLLMMAKMFDREVQGEWVPVYAAIYARFTYFVMPFVFWFGLVPSMPIVAKVITGALALVGYLAANIGSVSAQLPRWQERRGIRGGVRELADAFSLQAVLLISAMHAISTTLVYLIATLRVAIIAKNNARSAGGDTASATFTISPDAGDRRLTIAHLSDLHFMAQDANLGLEGANRNAETLAFFKRNATKLAETDVVAVTGDITDTGFRDEWQVADQAFALVRNARGGKGEGPRFAMVPGNHDINIFATFDPAVQRLEGADEKLGLFAVGKYASRSMRLIRYLAFYDQWSAAWSTLSRPAGHVAGASAYLSLPENKDKLNLYAAEGYRGAVSSEDIERIYDGAFPSVMDIESKAVILYTLDSNARTWHIGLNSYGKFGMGQLLRLRRLLLQHPKGTAAVILLHHHIKAGTKKKGLASKKLRKTLEEAFMVTADAFLLRWILNRYLPQQAYIFQGHTHFAREYDIGRHTVICAPSSGYGEGSEPGEKNIAHIFEFTVDKNGSLALNAFQTLT